MKNNRTIKWTLILMMLFWMSCAKKGVTESNKGKESIPPLTDIRVIASTLEKRQALEEIPGTVRSREHAIIAAKVSGTVERLPVTLGQLVKTGDLLLKINAQEISARLIQAEARLAQATNDLNRVKSLHAKGAATDSELEGVEARFRISRAVAEEAETMLGYASVRAPFDGVVTGKHVNEGGFATPGKPLLEIENPNKLRIETDVPEALIGFLKVGDSLDIMVHAKGQKMVGIVEEISPSASPVSRSFQVKLDLKSDSYVRSGQFARVAIPTRTIETLCVPMAALSFYGQMERIFVLEDGHIVLRLVKSGARFGDKIEILSGLSPDEQVVISDPSRLRDGQRAEVRP